MGKDIKEKYEKVCTIKDKALSLVETQLNGDLTQVDAKELGEVVDIAKDMAEIMKYCEEACYYHKVTEAMDEGSDEEKKYYLNKYIPEYEGKFYTPMHMARRRDSLGRYMYTEPMMYDDKADDSFRDRMYYSSMGNSGGSRMNYTNPMATRGLTNRDIREGRSGVTRMTYMDMKDSDKTSKMNKFKEYIDDIQKDMEEMFIEGKSTPEEKAYAKQALAQFISKM